MNHSSPFYFAYEFGGQVWLFHLIRTDRLRELHWAYGLLVWIEAVFHILNASTTVYLVYKAFRYPPVHPNLVLITNHTISILALCCLGRLGQIMFETQIIGNRNVVSTPLLVFSHIRLMGTITITRYGMGIYIERCLALRYVRDYERKKRLYIGLFYVIQDVILSNVIAWLFIFDYLPGYVCTLFTIVPHAVIFKLIKKLLQENEKRLDKLNNRNIRRPTIESKLGLIPRKFFGDSAKDMYTLSLRLQLDENIWCCKQLARGNNLVILAISFLVTFFTVPPLFTYTEDTEWILNLFVMVGNLLFPIGIFTVEVMIAWSLDRLRPNVYPALFINWITKKTKRESTSTIELNIIVADSEHYFGQLSQQWDRAFNIVHEIPYNDKCK